MSVVLNLRPMTFRTIFISDIHLGSKGCQAELLLDFLRSVRCETLYLVGDIIDFWSMKRGLYWPQAHNDVVRTVLGMARHGQRAAGHDSGGRRGRVHLFRRGDHDPVSRLTTESRGPGRRGYIRVKLS